MFFLLFFIFAALLLGSFHVGGISIRVLSTILIIGYCCYCRYFEKNKSRLYLNKTPIYLYTVFLLAVLLSKGISGGLSGYNEVSPFFSNLFAFFLLCYVAYFSIDQIAISKKRINRVFILLIAINLLNDIATYLQYSANEVGMSLGLLFTTTEGTYVLDVAEKLERVDPVHMAMPGIFGHGAINGYMTACLGILPLYYAYQGNKTLKWIGIILVALSIVGAFCCQERSGFGFIMVFIAITFWKFNSRNVRLILSIALILTVAFFVDDLSELFSSSDNMGRYADIAKFGSDREELTENAFKFIKNNFVWGGEEFYENLFGVTPHNFILHAFIYSGLIGATIIIGLFIYMLRDAVTIMIKSSSASRAYFFACSLTIFLLNGLFHSTSLVTGEVTIWILYACMLRSRQLNTVNL